MLLTDTSPTDSSSLGLSSLLKRSLTLVCGAFLLAGLMGQTANAQQAKRITTKALIGNSVSDPEADRYSDIGEAIIRFENRDQLSARTFLDKAVTKNPKLPPAGILIAKMYLLSGNSKAVRPALEQAVQGDSGNDPEPYLLLAEEALISNRTIEAEALFAKAASMIDGYSNNAKRKRLFVIRTNRGLAVIAERRQKWQESLSYLDLWLQQDPEDAAALTRKGQILFMLEKPAEGYQSFVDAKSQNDKLQSPYISAALMYSRLGKDREAMKSFERAFQEEKADERTMVAYSQALVKSGDMTKAVQILKQSQTSLPDSVNLWLLSGVANRMEGKTELAEEELMQALRLAPSNRDVLNQLAQILIGSTKEADKRRALAFASMNGQLNPENPDVNITFAWVLYQNGQPQKANIALQKAIRGGTLSADGQYLLARMLLISKNADTINNAKKLLTAALKNETGIFVEAKAAKTLLETL